MSPHRRKATNAPEPQCIAIRHLTPSTHRTDPSHQPSTGQNREMDAQQFRVKPGKNVDLDDWNPSETGNFSGSKGDAAGELERMNTQLAELQELLFGEHKHKVLVVLQGMDTSGKDGTIKHVFKAINPLGVKVANFKRPNTTELEHDFLWRVHTHAPGNGRIVIFNRSHYEDVLVARVHSLVPEETWKGRFEHINAFEKLLADEGTVIRKFFLNISKDEQRQRLQSRIDNPHKRWKFEGADLEERKYWDEYRVAYEDILTRTSTDHAPWYVVPSDRKWFRNLVVSQVLIETFEGLDMTYPEGPAGLEGIVVD